MELIKGINSYTQIATVFFILGKLTFFPVVVNLFSGNIELTRVLLFIYCIFILLSICFSLLSMKKIKQNKDLDIISDYNNGSFLIKVEDGKIIEVLQNI